MVESILKHTGRDTVRYVPGKIVPAAVNFIGLLVFTHIFSPEDFGNYFIVLTTITVMNIVGSSWIANSVVRFYSEFRLQHHLDEFLSTTILSLLIFNLATVLLYLSGLLIFEALIPEKLVPFLRLGALCHLFWSTYLTLLFFLRASFRASAYSKYEIISSTGRFLIALALVHFFNVGAISLLWSMLFISLFLVVLMLKRLSLTARLSWRAFSSRITWDFLKYGFPLALSSLSAWVLILSDRYMLQYFKTAEDVGIYSVSYSVVDRTLGLVYSTLMLAAYPVIVLTWETKGKEVTQHLIGELSRYFLILCVPIFAGISILGKDIFSLFIGADFFECFKLVPLFAFCSIAQGLFQYIGKSFELHRKTSVFALTLFIAGLVNVLLNVLLIPGFGYMGAGLAKVVSYLVLLILGIAISRSFMPWLAPMKSMVRVLLSAGGMAALLTVIKSHLAVSVTNLVLLTAIGTCAYCASLLLFKEMRKSEIDFVRSNYRKLIPVKFMGNRR